MLSGSHTSNVVGKMDVGSSDIRSLTNLQDKIRHNIAIPVKRVVDNRNRRDDLTLGRNNLRIERRKAGFVQAAAAPAGRRMAEVLKCASVFCVCGPIRGLALDVKHWNER